MTLADYVIFIAVAEQKNMTHVSEKLHLTRSAISHAVSRMEQELGFSLFIKTTHGVSLTTNGEMLLPLAHSVIQSHNHFHETVSSINGLDAGHVRLGVCSSTCINWVPEIVHTFPQVPISSSLTMRGSWPWSRPASATASSDGWS